MNGTPIKLELEYSKEIISAFLLTTKEEKEYLIKYSPSGTLEEKVDDIFNVITHNLYTERDFSLIEKFLICLQVRGYNYGVIIQEIATCNCGYVDHISYNILKETKVPTEIIESFLIEDLNINIDKNNILVNGVRLEECNAKVFNQVNSRINNVVNENKLTLEYKYTCESCGVQNKIYKNQDRIFDDILVNISLSDIYKYYVNMKTNYNLSFEDINNMYIFERGIYNKMFEDINTEE